MLHTSYGQERYKTNACKMSDALDGLMVTSLLHYRKFTRSLKGKNFVINPYDSCVWNKTISSKQLTICFHLDACKLSHRSLQVLDNTIEWLRKDYESIFEDGSGQMKVAHGKSINKLV